MSPLKRIKATSIENVNFTNKCVDPGMVIEYQGVWIILNKCVYINKDNYQIQLKINNVYCRQANN